MNAENGGDEEGGGHMVPTPSAIFDRRFLTGLSTEASSFEPMSETDLFVDLVQLAIISTTSMLPLLHANSKLLRKPQHKVFFSRYPFGTTYHEFW